MSDRFLYILTLAFPMEGEDLLNAVYTSVTDYAIMTFDKEGQVTSWNVGAEHTFGYTRDEAIGKSADFIFTEEDRKKNAPKKEMETACHTGRSKDYRWHIRKDHSRFWADGVMTLLRNGNGEHVGYLKILKDITGQKRLEDELHRLARYDVLTGVSSRASFDSMLEEMSALCARSGQRMNLLLVDLDHFKQVNDTLGHPVGDALLKQVAHRIRHLTREADFIARLGGDEFAILQLNVNSPVAGGELAAKLIDELGKPFEINGHLIHIGTSIGVAVCPDDAERAEQLMMKADLALYMAKESGRNNFHYFTDELEEESHKRHLYNRELRHAVQHRQFWLGYQPKIDSKNGKTVGMEALLRCSNPVLSQLAVDEVIELARELRLSQIISEWVLQEACRQLRSWKDMGLGHIRMSVNLCPPELNDGPWLRRMQALISELGINPDEIEVEVTERLAMDFQNGGLAAIHGLREKGISVALDDFGTGYSSLGYLTKLPIDILKLDQAFLQNVPHDPHSCAVARGVIQLALQLGLEVVAEGVESQEQADFLREANCTVLQGFLISKPLPAPEMTAWLLR